MLCHHFSTIYLTASKNLVWRILLYCHYKSSDRSRHKLIACCLNLGVCKRFILLSNICTWQNQMSFSMNSFHHWLLDSSLPQMFCVKNKQLTDWNRMKVNYESSSLGIAGKMWFPNCESVTETKYPFECELAYSKAILLEWAAAEECIGSECNLELGSWDVLATLGMVSPRGGLEGARTTGVPETGGVPPCCINCCFCCCNSCRILCLLCLSPWGENDMVCCNIFCIYVLVYSA